jgi:hypothetical protein
MMQKKCILSLMMLHVWVGATKVGNINLISIHHHGVDKLVQSEGG